MCEVSKAEVSIDHHAVEALSGNLPVHLGRLPCFSSVFELNWPSSAAHLFEHENREESHHEVEDVVDRDRYEENNEVIWFVLGPIILFLDKAIQIWDADPH